MFYKLVYKYFHLLTIILHFDALLDCIFIYMSSYKSCGGGCSLSITSNMQIRKHTKTMF